MHPRRRSGAETKNALLSANSGKSSTKSSAEKSSSRSGRSENSSQKEVLLEETSTDGSGSKKSSH